MIKGDIMIKELVRLANHLDNKGYRKEADYLDRIIKRAQELSDELISSELVDLVATYPNVQVAASAVEIKDKVEEQRLRDLLHGSEYLAGRALTALSATQMRDLHKELRFSPAFQYELTRADTDQAEIDEMNLASGLTTSDYKAQWAERASETDPVSADELESSEKDWYERGGVSLP